MACGCPVFASNHAALKETCGGCAKLADPGDIEAMAKALREVLEDEDWRTTILHIFNYLIHSTYLKSIYKFGK